MPQPNPKIIYLTAGAAGMYCGSCMHDNALAKALAEQGWDIQLVPTYTPIRTDEDDFSIDHVLFGGLNVYLQQKIPFFRYLPSAFDRILDNPRLIRRVTAKALETDAKTLGSLTLSMLQGANGNQRKEVRRMCDWLKQEKPDLLIFTNILIGGCIETIKQELGIPVLVTLQGDDVFLDSLEEPFRSKCMEQIRRIARSVDGFIVHTEFFRDYMSEYFGIDPQQFHVTPLGIDVSDFERFASDSEVDSDQPRTIGYLARLAPEKGLHHLVEAFIQLKTTPEFKDVQLKVAGWLGPQNKSYADDLWQKLDDAGLQEDYEYLGSVERDAKLKLLSHLDIFCVPTEYREPKGLYALEAMAAGVPIVQPDHGAFPELIEASGGGVLFEKGNTRALSDALAILLTDVDKCCALGKSGQQHVHQFRNARMMATTTAEVINHHLSDASRRDEF
jgi:glycosyltransferase involved in cell wall biosynthesis